MFIKLKKKRFDKNVFSSTRKMSAINLTLINNTSRFNNKIVEATANNGIRSTFPDPVQYWMISKMPPHPYQRRSVIEENENEIQLTSPTICMCRV